LIVQEIMIDLPKDVIGVICIYLQPYRVFQIYSITKDPFYREETFRAFERNLREDEQNKNFTSSKIIPLIKKQREAKDKEGKKQKSSLAIMAFHFWKKFMGFQGPDLGVNPYYVGFCKPSSSQDEKRKVLELNNKYRMIIKCVESDQYDDVVDYCLHAPVLDAEKVCYDGKDIHGVTIKKIEQFLDNDYRGSYNYKTVINHSFIWLRIRSHVFLRVYFGNFLATTYYTASKNNKSLNHRDSDKQYVKTLPDDISVCKKTRRIYLRSNSEKNDPIHDVVQDLIDTKVIQTLIEDFYEYLDDDEKKDIADFLGLNQAIKQKKKKKKNKPNQPGRKDLLFKRGLGSLLVKMMKFLIGLSPEKNFYEYKENGKQNGREFFQEMYDMYSSRKKDGKRFENELMCIPYEKKRMILEETFFNLLLTFDTLSMRKIFEIYNIPCLMTEEDLEDFLNKKCYVYFIHFALTDGFNIIRFLQ
jgi:hypothetical protein